MNGAKSLILITVDCLRADHTGFMGYGRPTTPFLDGLAAESLVFPKAIVVGAPTYYSFPGIMASRYPLALGRDVVGLAPGEPTLATVLQQSGYRTAAYVAGNPYLAGRFGYALGFDIFEDFLSGELSGATEAVAEDDASPRVRTRWNDRVAAAAHRVGALGRLYDELYFQYRQRIAAPKTTWDKLRRFPAADVLVDRAGEWLRSVGQQPFFLWLHFMDPHAPYYPSAEALQAVGARIEPGRGRYLNVAWTEMGESRARRYRDEIVQLYDAGIRRVDTEVGRLVEMLRQFSLWDSSVLALTADHGEEFLDHGGRFHYSSRPYQEMLHVPLLLRVPGMMQKSVVSEAPFSHLHLAPTILDALGVEAPPEFEGRSYWTAGHGDGKGECAISESVGQCTNPMDAARRMHGRVLAVQDRRFKLVLDFDHKSELLFDLENDPRELRALAVEAHKSEHARLLGVALTHLSRKMGGVNRERAIRARLHEIGLEWKHSKMDSKTLAS